jgi:monoamine oxidase
MNDKILIIGAGLSGLVIGYRLKKAGIPFVIIEARNRIGGRVHTKESINQTPVELGATWFTSQHRNLINLLEELDIKYFEQYMEGTSFYQPYSTSPADAITLPSQPPSYRISGGTSYLIQTLKESIGIENILLGEKVKSIEFLEESIKIQTEKLHTCTKVVLALPPKLWGNNIKFTPSLPPELMETALTTHTWMEDSIKIALTYKEPFWKINQQSGTLFSNSGPITELYDHCNVQKDRYALCGFINSTFGNLSANKRKEAVINQVTSVFGSAAKDFIDYNEIIWSNENETFAESLTSLYPHQNNGNITYRKTYFKNKLLIASSEASEIHSGYMDGAIYSANFVIEKIKVANNVYKK